MKIKQAIELGKNELSDFENNYNIVKTLLLSHLDISFEKLYLNLDQELPNEEIFLKNIKDFKNSKPLEYITGKASFYSLDFKVFEGVLIPRPETEILVQKVIDISKNLNKELKICEIGVGSGIISTVLALNINAKIVSTDISEIAIKNAKENIQNFKVQDRVKLIHTSYLDGINEDFDILVSNPPYIANNYKLDNWVLNEPKNALFGGDSGDEILKEIIKLADLKNIKIIACEMGYDQKKSMSDELKKYNYKAEFYKDLAGFDRGFIAIKN
ncbi:protein-(glutamine-N5) methyltransferase [Campylobacter pinnipediorum subsp. pinnipediorum]|uniref:HemK/PrmC family methyltransferase n=1 Tax=Campylobacter pinnipediorum TaxID=1965231 RepID=UPI000995CBA8|nr:HemK/PrmC family methyltransferase [Campylobacter pinnipediorum]AQW81153.1 protein-(glutamine-N5) methyltransferase [Campylobacter pinnipediorum subsp. pinnipediorum]